MKNNLEQKMLLLGEYRLFCLLPHVKLPIVKY